MKIHVKVSRANGKGDLNRLDAELVTETGDVIENILLSEPEEDLSSIGLQEDRVRFHFSIQRKYLIKQENS